MRKLEVYIKIFRPGKRMYMYTLPSFMDAVLSEERQLRKWVGVFQVGIFWVGTFRGETFQGGGEFDGWEFSGWEFSRGKFS